MGCCCSKKQVAIQQQQRQIDYEALKRKWAKPIVNYVVQENQSEIQTAITEGFAPDLPFDIGGQDSTLLILSIVYNKPNITQFLLQYNQDVNILIQPKNDNALQCAVSAGNIAIVKLLIQKGAKTSLKGKNGMDPKQLADSILDKKRQKGDVDGAAIYENILKILNQ